LSFGTQARADWRVLTSAVVIGSGVGLALGGLYLAGGLGRTVLDHARAVQTAQVATVMRGPLDPATVSDVLEAAVKPADLASAAKPAPPPAAAPAKSERASELDCLAQAVYFEARGESARGQAAVATVIMNRVKSPKFPKTVCGVVYQGASHRNGCQFSFACDGAAERVVERAAWRRARAVAARVLSGAVLRDVGSATHFHATGVDPQWGPRMMRVAQVGLHVFYRFNPRGAAPKLDNETDPPKFVSRPMPVAPDLRLAAAVLAPSAEAPSAARPPAAAAVVPPPAVGNPPAVGKPPVRLEPIATSGPIGKGEAGPQAKGAAAKS
jgi:spore germination cell wall hydrolase CwlJ-like protein